jgi:hypothetical protein
MRCKIGTPEKLENAEKLISSFGQNENANKNIYFLFA